MPQARRFCGAERSQAALEIEARTASKTTHSNYRRPFKFEGYPRGCGVGRRRWGTKPGGETYARA